MIVHNYGCNGCNVRHIEGKLFECSICIDYGLCEDCMAKNFRTPPCDLGHDFQDLTFQDTSGTYKSYLSLLTYKYCWLFFICTFLIF